MLSNDVAALAPGESCEALLLTPKARVIAPMRVLRRGPTTTSSSSRSPGSARRSATSSCGCASPPRPRSSSRSTPRRSSSAAGRGDPERTTTVGPPSRCSTPRLEPTLDEDALEAMRIEAGTPAWGKRDRRPGPPRRGRPRRARRQPDEGLLPGPGADRPPPLPRAREPRAPRPRGRGRGAARARTTSSAWATRSSAGSPARPASNGGIVALAYVRAEVAAGRGARPGPVESPAATLTHVPRP